MQIYNLRLEKSTLEEAQEREREAAGHSTSVVGKWRQ